MIEKVVINSNNKYFWLHRTVTIPIAALDWKAFRSTQLRGAMRKKKTIGYERYLNSQIEFGSYKFKTLTMIGIGNWIIPAALKNILQIGGNGLIWIKNGSGRVALEKKPREGIWSKCRWWAKPNCWSTMR